MFSFEKNYVLKNERVELSPLSKEHEPLLFKASDDPDIWTHFTENGYGEVQFGKYISAALEKKKQNQEYPLVIKDLASGQYVGMTRIYDVSNQLRNVKLGHTWIGKAHQGTGLNKNCKYLLFQFLFDEMNMERIGFGASELNKKSIRALKSVGCKIEGELRHFLPIEHSDERVSIVLMSIIKSEWQGSIKANFKFS